MSLNIEVLSYQAPRSRGEGPGAALGVLLGGVERSDMNTGWGDTTVTSDGTSGLRAS